MALLLVNGFAWSFPTSKLFTQVREKGRVGLLFSGHLDLFSGFFKIVCWDKSSKPKQGKKIDE